ncbi:MAG: aryl-sulfate sulfotransferase [Planctomycetota bacterium]
MNALAPIAWFSCIFSTVTAAACDPTVGWLGSAPGAFSGYTLFSPMASNQAFLVDDHGRVVQTWTAATLPGNSVYLLDDGRLLRPARVPGPLPPLNGGGVGGRVELLDWDSTLLWRFTYSSPSVQQHHDVEMLPNGNVLVLAWERKTSAEAIALGRDPAFITQGAVWPEHIIEVTPTGPTSGQIVWEWHLWDHLVQDFDPAAPNFGVIADHPGRVDLNAGPNGAADWIHANSIDYNAELDQILISANRFDEIWIIDHSTTTAEAAGATGGNSGRGGDLLYRWGNPAIYGRGSASDHRLFRQHCAEWIPQSHPGGGNIMIFNNGVGRPGPDYSSVEEIVPPVEPGGTYTLTPNAPFGPATAVWTYVAANPTDLFASIVSSARRLPNGNTVICDGPPGRFLEVTNAGDVVWSYINPVTGSGAANSQGQSIPGTCFRVDRLPPDHPGLAGRSLDPSAPLEIYPLPFDFDGNGLLNQADFDCFSDRFTGACPTTLCPAPIFADASGYAADSDGDGDIDCDDWSAFSAAWTGGSLVFAPCGANFQRGDATGDGHVDIADAVRTLGYLFTAELAGCEAALDVNDDESIDIGDAVYVLSALFSGGLPIPEPVLCGADPTAGPIGCGLSPCP